MKVPDGHRTVSILLTRSRHAHFFQKVPVQYLQQLKWDGVFPCAIVGFEDFIHLRKFLKIAPGSVMKPMNMCKLPNLARIMPLEEPLDSSEPKRTSDQITTSAKGFPLLPPVIS